MMLTPKRKNDDKAKGRPRPLRMILGIGALLLLISGIAGFAFYRSSYTPLTEVPSANLLFSSDAKAYRLNFQTGERTDASFPIMMIDSRETSPDGQWEARFEFVNGYYESVLLLDDLTKGETPRNLGTFYGADNTISWSPDQKWLAFTAYDPEIDTRGGGHQAEIWMISTETGELKRLTNNTYLDSDPFFSPDGTQLVYMSARDSFARVYVMDVATGESKLVTPEQYGDNPKWSPDGQWIAFEAFLIAPGIGMVNTTYRNIYVVRVDGTHGQFVTYGIDQSGALLGWQAQ
jgi:Tol biopolymer transport system component